LGGSFALTEAPAKINKLNNSLICQSPNTTEIVPPLDLSKTCLTLPQHFKN